MKNNKKITFELNNGDELNEFTYCYSIFSSMPNKYIINNPSDETSESFYEIEEDLLVINKITENSDGFLDQKILYKYNDNIYISCLSSISQNIEYLINITFIYKEDSDLKTIEELGFHSYYYQENEINKEENKLEKKLNLISISDNSLNLTGIEIEPLVDIKLFYNKETFKRFKKLIKKIENNNKGLSIFFGEKGTGKTSIVKQLTKKLNKEVIYIPNNIIDQTINNPEFKNFINIYNNSLIILDDCEYIINNNYNNIVNNLLQLIDGLDSDLYSVNFLLIFNQEESEINQDIIDCNNVLDIIEFNYLSEKESEKLSKHLDKEIKFGKNKLIDIVKNKSEFLSNKDIGF